METGRRDDKNRTTIILVILVLSKFFRHILFATQKQALRQSIEYSQQTYGQK